MTAHNGTLKDSFGNPLYPLSVAEQILVTMNGQQVPLSDVLQSMGVVSQKVIEQEFTLEAALDPGDLYTVPAYVVGNCRIQIWRDGVYLHGGETGMWQEYGEAGKESTLVFINDAIPAQSVLTVRISS